MCISFYRLTPDRSLKGIKDVLSPGTEIKHDIMLLIDLNAVFDQAENDTWESVIKNVLEEDE